MHALLFAALLATGAPEPLAEVDYAAGTLGYQALLKGDLALAERQLAASQAANRHDGAWLLNYGQLLARQGRVNEAREVFRRVGLAPDSEVVLASGEVIGTRQASRIAAHGLTKQSLSAR